MAILLASTLTLRAGFRLVGERKSRLRSKSPIEGEQRAQVCDIWLHHLVHPRLTPWALLLRRFALRYTSHPRARFWCHSGARPGSQGRAGPNREKPPDKFDSIPDELASIPPKASSLQPTSRDSQSGRPTGLETQRSVGDDTVRWHS